MTHDSADLAAVLALEEPAKALLEAIRATQPAIERLEGADYPGAEWLRQAVEFTVQGDCSGGLEPMLGALEMFRAANGRLAAFDFEFYSGYLGLSTDKAVDAMVESIGTEVAALDRIKAMQSYAATVA